MHCPNFSYGDLKVPPEMSLSLVHRQLYTAVSIWTSGLK